MLFGGMQKLTLLDYPDKTACTLFTAGCNYRCPFCHNGSLVFPAGKSDWVDEGEILMFLETRQGLLDGVCISGGEPLMHQELSGFIKKVKAMGFSVKLDTNGSFPEKLKKLVGSGLIDYVAMDVKNTPEKYAKTVGVSGYDVAPIQESVSFLLEGSIPYEFRTTVVREFHTAADLLSLAGWIAGADKYFLQNFIDSEDVLQKGLHGYSKPELEGILGEIRGLLPSAELRGI